MNPLIQLTGQPLENKIVEVFSKAAGRTLKPADILSAIKFPFGTLVQAVRALDVAGAFIPEADLRRQGQSLTQVAQLSAAWNIHWKNNTSIWDRVCLALAQGGALAATSIDFDTTLQQIGGGSDWIHEFDKEFVTEGLRFFDSDFEKCENANDVFQIVLGLLQKKT